MNVFMGLVFYMVIGGVITSGAFEKHVEDCKGSQPLEDEFFKMAAVWPALVVNAVLIDESDFVRTNTCHKPQPT